MTDRPERRVAIYCRKSVMDGLDQEFNSLDAQRQAVETYVGLQIDNGWAALPKRYDDGGFSGGNIDRPALKRLLEDVETGQVDTILVYKLDRMSRSLVDFVKIHEYLEKRSVALVSVTESINTKTPHGRMMVNILFSFAQYERELIGDRTSDKMSAARRRGKWTGGCPPLGFDLVDGKLVVNKDEAHLARKVFALYLKHRSLQKVVAESDISSDRRVSITPKRSRMRIPPT